MNEELLEEFIKWYWGEIDNKPYHMMSSEVVKWFLEGKNKS